MDPPLRSMDQFPMQQSIIHWEFPSILSPKKFTLQIHMAQISEDGIEHPKLLELSMDHYQAIPII